MADHFLLRRCVCGIQCTISEFSREVISVIFQSISGSDQGNNFLSARALRVMFSLNLFRQAVQLSNFIRHVPTLKALTSYC